MLDWSPSQRQQQAKAEVLRVALRRWRDPGSDALDTLYLGDYADDMQLLLQVANQDSECLSEAVALTGASTQDLVDAAVHYIEHVCLQAHGNPQRILGVRADASDDTIKRQYRMLIKLFHPDRALIAQPRAEACAAAINQAYKQIRNHHALESSFTASTSNAGRQTSAPVMPSSADMAQSIPESVPFVPAAQESQARFKSVPIHYLGWGVACTVVLALLLMLDLRTAPMELTAAAPDARMDKTQEAAQVPAVASEQPSAATQLQQTLLAYTAETSSEFTPGATHSTETQKNGMTAPAVASQSPTVASQTKAAAQIKADAVQPELLPPLQAKAAKTEPATTGGMPQTVLAATPPVQAQGQFVQPSTPVSTSVATAATVDNSLAHKATLLSEQHLRELVMQFVDSYNRGDIERFAALMQPQVRGTEGNTLAEVREAYRKLFASSAQREIVLKDPQWDIHGSTAVGLMEYQVSIRANGSQTPASAAGRLKLEVRMVDQSAKISTFINTPAQP